MKIVFLLLVLTFSPFGLAHDALTHKASSKEKQTEQKKGFIIGYLRGQLGNHFFRVATASALAWDNDAEAHFPDLIYTPPEAEHVFFRCNLTRPEKPIEFTWGESCFDYHPLVYHPNMLLDGNHQSEKYFAHHRNRLLKLFAPREDDLKYMQIKYGWLINNPHTVGVQIRYYRWEVSINDIYQYGRDYLEKAMALFPDDSLFIVTTNNIAFAKKNIPPSAKNVYFIENEPNYIALFLQSMCQHNIITNSTFGWWGAWLNQNPNKIVVAPTPWIFHLPCQDVCPKEWILIKSENAE